MGPDDTPYGVLALVADPVGAQFKLRASPRAQAKREARRDRSTFPRSPGRP
jgi:hypothetical protein